MGHVRPVVLMLWMWSCKAQIWPHQDLWKVGADVCSRSVISLVNQQALNPDPKLRNTKNFNSERAVRSSYITSCEFFPS